MIGRPNGSENVLVNFLFPVFITIIHTHLLLSRVDEPPWWWIARNPIQVQKEKSNFMVACLRAP